MEKNNKGRLNYKYTRNKDTKEKIFDADCILQ
jgi:hypothetical protein